MLTGRALFCWMTAWLLAGCATPLPPSEQGPTEPPRLEEAAPLEALYPALVREGGSLYRLNPGQSTIRIYAFRGGKAIGFGHNHVLSAPAFEGFFYLAPAGSAESRFDLRFRLDALAFDQPEHRAALGPAFATPLSDDAVASTREHMLGDNNFQARDFPLVQIRSLQITGEAPKFAARIAVELHGQVREMWVPLTVTGLPDHLGVDGALVLRQTDFGVKPFSVLGGVLAMQDEVVVEFTLRGAPSNGREALSIQ